MKIYFQPYSGAIRIGKDGERRGIPPSLRVPLLMEFRLSRAGTRWVEFEVQSKKVKGADMVLSAAYDKSPFNCTVLFDISGERYTCFASNHRTCLCKSALRRIFGWLPRNISITKVH